MVLPLIIENEYNTNDTSFIFRRGGDKRIFSFLVGDTNIVITKSDEMSMTVDELIIVINNLRNWLFEIKKVYNIPQEYDTTFSIRFFTDNLKNTLSFDEQVSFENIKADNSIILKQFPVPLTLTLASLLRRTQEILDWIQRDFNIWNEPLQSFL